MNLSTILSRLYGRDGWRCIDRGRGAGVEIDVWERPEPRPNAEQISEWNRDWDDDANDWRPETAIGIKAAAERLPEQKLVKLAELDAAQAAREKAGVTIGSITLASSEYDQRRLATLLVGINEALAAGIYSTESAVSVTMANDVDVELTVGQFKLLAIAYMGRCMEQRVQYRRTKAQIESAISKAELDGIEV